MTETATTGRRAGSMKVVRSRGALSGFLLVLLGLWGAFIPFVGPYFDYAYTPLGAWNWTWGRLWLEILPGIAAIIGGLLLAITANRAVGVFGGYLASAAGGWFIVGPILGRLWSGPSGASGVPIGSTARQVAEQLGFFYGLGGLILFFAAHAVGRFTVRSVRDVRAAERARERREAEATAVTITPVPVTETRVTEAPVTGSTATGNAVTETQVIPTTPAEPARTETTFADNRAVQPEEAVGRHEDERGSEDAGASRLSPGARPPR